MANEKTVLVTGASGGIGRVVCRAAARAGYRVAAHYRSNAEAAQSLRDELAAAGGAVDLLRFDVTDREECSSVLGDWVEKNGAPWGIVCGAGITADNAFPALSGGDWDSVIRTNLDGLYNVLQPLFMPLARKRQGRIVTIASVSGIAGNRGQVNYSAAKAGVIGATKALAVELASRGITVNCVAPGLIDTDMLKKVPPDILSLITRQVPLGRVGTPEEAAAAVLFLLSDAASYITRQVISVNGGLV
ncbi:MAG: 3-oxoacyl-ACP reductase FabG [Treponema sp.]|jgi:3-oxoacyl-[acyl-carrier protein] reductase|nr:3-oxoacyl-ACP reductase FabG [Treponema sp.]